MPEFSNYRRHDRYRIYEKDPLRWCGRQRPSSTFSESYSITERSTIIKYRTSGEMNELRGILYLKTLICKMTNEGLRTENLDEADL
jgi:hypothetical protein